MRFDDSERGNNKDLSSSSTPEYSVHPSDMVTVGQLCKRAERLVRMLRSPTHKPHVNPT